MPSNNLPVPDLSKRSLVLVGIIISFCIFLFSSTTLALLLKPAHLNEETLMFFSRICFWICTIAIYAYAVNVEKQRLLLWTEKKYPFLFYVGSIISILLILLAGITIISLIGMPLGLHNKSTKLNGMVSVLRKNKLLLVFTCLTAGVTEELIFRGYLIPRLQLFIKNPTFALIISSVLFGIAHIGYGSIAQIIGPIFIGFIFALYYQKYRNIKILILCHFLWDFLTLLILTR